MSNKCKVGLDYFPFDAAFFEDDKIQLIHAEYGPKGVMIAIKLLCKIYKEGYYYKWGDDQCLLFSKNAGVEFAPGFVSEVVNGLIRRSFFDKGVFDSFGILTSSGIQKRYFDATGRYKKLTIISEYLLITPPSRENVYIIKINVDINAKNVDVNPHNGNGSNNGSESDNGSKTATPIIKTPAYEYMPPFQDTNHTGPKIEDVKFHFIQNGFQEDFAERFFDRYEATGWMIGESKIKNWKSVANKWLNDPKKFSSPASENKNTQSKVEHNLSELQKAVQLNNLGHGQ